ncbi:hypothetical protein [Propionibacterium freudenreichii]|uniref:hypothetical protein n=1 Tax=Propionibacterium freudenreichii TaxID=1744 RepID=UPI00254ADEFE|nr:hypothetical protein [Propionibacterium freudenreichii]
MITSVPSGPVGQRDGPGQQFHFIGIGQQLGGLGQHRPGDPIGLVIAMWMLGAVLVASQKCTCLGPALTS